MKNDNSGLRKACLYALPPHWRGQCGPKNKKKSSLIYDFAGGKDVDTKELMDILVKNFVVSGYYKLIAKTHGLDIFDEKVVEAYWIGNKLLDKFFETAEIIPYHLYHVLVVGSFKDDHLGQNKCRISWGEVIKTTPELFKVKSCSLAQKNGNFVLGKPVSRTAIWDKNFIPKLKTGDVVSMHWNYPIEILEKNELEKLQYYTKLTLDICARTAK